MLTQESRKRTKRGGARPGSGRRRQRIVLEPSTATILALLKKHYQQTFPEITEDQIVTNLLLAAWDDLHH